MKNKYLMLMVSWTLLVLSLIGTISRLIIPTIRNMKYEKELENLENGYINVASKVEQKISNMDITKINNDEYRSIPETDAERVGMYIGQYINYVNNKEYEKAYNLLADGFRKLNFPTYDSYVRWAKKEFARRKTVEYGSYRLEGYIYVAEVKLTDMYIYDNPVTVDKVFTFEEIEPGRFEISFGL